MSKEKVLNYGVGFWNIKKNKAVTHYLTSIHVDNFNHTIRLVIEKGVELDQVEITMEHAQEIGFINLDVLSSYLK